MKDKLIKLAKEVMPILNKELAQIFDELALYEKSLNRSFPAAAFRKSAKAILNAKNIKCLEDVSDIDNIGNSSLEVIKEYLETGISSRHQKALNAIKPIIAPLNNKIKELCEIPGIGEVNAEKLLNKGIKSKNHLMELCEKLNAGDEIPNTGMNISTTMFAGMKFEAHCDKNRMSVKEHDELANPMLEWLNKQKKVIKTDVVGSRRRFNNQKKYTIGDVDLIVATEDENFWKTTIDLLDLVVMAGPKKVSGIKNSKHIDIKFTNNSNWGAMLMHGTGSAMFNIKMRQIAIAKGLSLSEYGLKNNKTQEYIAGSTEEEIFKKLNIEYVKPQDRNLK